MTTATDQPPATFDDIELPLPDRRSGKVRVSYALDGGRRLFVTTDRLSAFDRVIARVPLKGQVLNQLAAHWFALTADIVANHVLAVPDPNVLVATAATPLPVEVIVRGHITGVTSTSLWTRYAAGQRVIDGHHLPEGMRKNEPLPKALVTPTTKAEAGEHDEPLSPFEVVQRGLVPARTWGLAMEAALELFRRGREVAAAAGLILADTKYEFGTTPDGRLLLIDEVHTPDSSRFWVAATYEQRLAAGDEPESLDKELVRRALAGVAAAADHPMTPEEQVAALPDDIWVQTSARYIDAYERLTGQRFAPGAQPVADRIVRTLTAEGYL